MCNWGQNTGDKSAIYSCAGLQYLVVVFEDIISVISVTVKFQALETANLIVHVILLLYGIHVDGSRIPGVEFDIATAKENFNFVPSTISVRTLSRCLIHRTKFPDILRGV